MKIHSRNSTWMWLSALKRINERDFDQRNSIHVRVSVANKRMEYTGECESANERYTRNGMHVVRIRETLPRLRCYLATRFANSKAWRYSWTLPSHIVRVHMCGCLAWRGRRASDDEDARPVLPSSHSLDRRGRELPPHDTRLACLAPLSYSSTYRIDVRMLNANTLPSQWPLRDLLRYIILFSIRDSNRYYANSIR